MREIRPCRYNKWKFAIEFFVKILFKFGKLKLKTEDVT